MKRIFILLPLVIAFSACSTPMVLEPSRNEGASVKIIYMDGDQVLLSHKGLQTVAVRILTPNVKAGGRAKFVITAINYGNEEFDFSTRNIMATEVGVPLHVFTYKEIKNEIKSREMWASVAAAFNGASRSISAANAGYQNSYGSVSAYDSSGGSIYGTYSGYSYNSGAAEVAQNEAQAETDRQMRNIRENALSALGRAKNILKRTTVVPGSSAGGEVIIALPPAKKWVQIIDLRVRAGDVSHKFLIDYKEK